MPYSEPAAFSQAPAAAFCVLYMYSPQITTETHAWAIAEASQVCFSVSITVMLYKICHVPLYSPQLGCRYKAIARQPAIMTMSTAHGLPAHPGPPTPPPWV